MAFGSHDKKFSLGKYRDSVGSAVFLFSYHQPWKQPLQILSSRKATRSFDWPLLSINVPCLLLGQRAHVRSSTGSRGWRWRKTTQRTSGSLEGSQPHLCHQKLLLFMLNPTWEHSGVCLWPRRTETMALGGPGLVPHDINHLLLWFSCHFICSHTVDQCFHMLGWGLFSTIYSGQGKELCLCLFF